MIETFLTNYVPELNGEGVSMKEIKESIEVLHKNCYDFSLHSCEEHVLMDITFDTKSHNFFSMEAKNVENQ